MAKPSFPPPAVKQKKDAVKRLFCFVIRSQALRAGHPHPILQFHIAQASALYFRYAQVPNARLGNVNASIDASLA
jgi:hypothetical protein